MDEYDCIGCNYTYHPGRGDEKRSVVPGTSFESLPDNWTCPECGAGKMGFRKRIADGGTKARKAEDDLKQINAEQVAWKSSANR